MPQFDVHRISKSDGKESIKRVVASDSSEAQRLVMDDLHLIGEALPVRDANSIEHSIDTKSTSPPGHQNLSMISFAIVIAAALISASVYFRPSSVSTVNSYPYAFPPAVTLSNGSVLLAGVRGGDTFGQSAANRVPMWFTIEKDGLAYPVTSYPGTKTSFDSIYHIYAVGAR